MHAVWKSLETLNPGNVSEILGQLLPWLLVSMWLQIGLSKTAPSFTHFDQNGNIFNRLPCTVHNDLPVLIALHVVFTVSHANERDRRVNM